MVALFAWNAVERMVRRVMRPDQVAPGDIEIGVVDQPAIGFQNRLAIGAIPAGMRYHGITGMT